MRVKIEPMHDEPTIPETDIGGLPADFGTEAVLLDVREHDEWQRGHAADARHIPMGEVPARLREIDPAAPVYVICQAGIRSLQVARYLQRSGYRPVNVTGGMLAWASAGRPVVTDDGRPGDV